MLSSICIGFRTQQERHGPENLEWATSAQTGCDKNAKTTAVDTAGVEVNAVVAVFPATFALQTGSRVAYEGPYQLEEHGSIYEN